MKGPPGERFESMPGSYPRPIRPAVARGDSDLSLSRGKSDEHVDGAHQLQALFEEVRRLPRQTIDPVLEDLHEYVEADPQGGGLPPGLEQPVQAGPKELADVHEEPDAEGRRRPHHDEDREQSPPEWVLGTHEEPRVDDLGAEQHTIEIDLTDAEHGHRRHDRDLEHERLAAALGRPSLARRQNACGDDQDDLEILHDAVLDHQPAAELPVTEGHQHHYRHDDDARQEGDAAAAQPSKA